MSQLRVHPSRAAMHGVLVPGPGSTRPCPRLRPAAGRPALRACVAHPAPRVGWPGLQVLLEERVDLGEGRETTVSAQLV